MTYIITVITDAGNASISITADNIETAEIMADAMDLGGAGFYHIEEITN